MGRKRAQVDPKGGLQLYIIELQVYVGTLRMGIMVLRYV